jgi:hypothetical protein
VLHNLTNQTAEIFNYTVSTTPDEYGILETTFVSAGKFGCRVIPWPGKDTEFEFDRDTRRSIMRIILVEQAAGVLLGTSRIQLVTQSQMGNIRNSNVVGPTDPNTIYEVQGDPQIFYRRTAISHVEALLRELEG